MKILLVNPASPRTVSTKPVLRHDPPVGLLNLASYLKAAGDETVEILDTALTGGNIPPEKISAIAAGEYVLVGFTVLMGEFLTNAIAQSREVRRANLKTRIVWGNVLAAQFDEEILNKYPVDFVVSGDGEFPLSMLAGCLQIHETGFKIPGLSYKGEGAIVRTAPLDRMEKYYPVPDWSFLPVNAEQIPYYFRLCTSLGCPYRCSFCYNAGGSWRPRPAWHVISEIENIHKLTGARVFTLGDDNFFGQSARAIEILNYCRAKGFYVEQAIAHMNGLRHNVIDACGGVVQTISYAIESASDRIQSLINKKLKVRDCGSVNAALYEKGITTIHPFIAGFQGETNAELRLNVELMFALKAINPYVRAVMSMLFPIPGSKMWGDIVADGYELPKGIAPHAEGFFYTWKFKEGGEPRDGNIFRPWLNPARYAMLNAYCRVFNDLFQANNLALSPESEQDIRDFSELPRIFEGHGDCARPSKYYHPYVLDRLLRGEKIDLSNDLKNPPV